MGIKLCPVKKAVRPVARQFFDGEKERLGLLAFIKAYNSRRYGKTKEKGKELIKLIVKNKEVRRVYLNERKSRTGSNKVKASTSLKQWLTDTGTWRTIVEYGRQYVKVGQYSGSSIPVGEVTFQGRNNSAEGSALAAAQDGEGLYQYFDNFEMGMAACQTLLQAAKGEEVSDIPDIFGCFRPGKPLEIALEQATYELELLAAKSGCSVNDVLGGHSLEDIIFGMSFDDLKEMAMTRGKKGAAGTDAYHNGALRFLTLANLKVFVDDIICDLEDRKCAAVPLKDGFGPYSFLTVIEERILVQNCHGGGTARHGFNPKDEYEREWTTDPYRYVVDKYGKDGHIIDMKAETNYDNDSAINAKVPIPGEDASYARILTIDNPRIIKGLTTFQVAMDQGNGNGFAKRVHHQVLQQVLASSGSGMMNHDELNEFLGGMTFEEKYPFKARTERRYLRMLEDWQKQYPGIEFAKWCDVDHCVGRSERWMNNVLFTNLCSHRWNQCMAAVRIRAGDWCFGLGTKAYGDGND